MTTEVSPSRFARVAADNDREDDFLEVEIGGRKAQVFRPRCRGKRLANYYVKGYPPGQGKKAFYQSTGVSTKGLALDAARKLWRAAIEGRFDVLEKTKIRQPQRVATIGEIVAAHERGIHQFNLTVKPESARGYRNSLRLLLEWAMRPERGRGGGDEAKRRVVDVAAIDRLPADVLTEETVEAFLRNYLAPAGSDLLARDRRVHGARAAVRLARMMFEPQAMKCYRGLNVPDLSGFRAAALPEAPELARDEIDAETMREMSKAALDLRESNPALYLVHLLFRHAGMRNDEIENARVEWIERAGPGDVRGVTLPSGECRPIAAYVSIRKRAYWKPKQSSGRVALSWDVFAELRRWIDGRAGEELLVPAPTKTARWELINVAHNDFVRPWLGGFRKRSYELRRWAATTIATLHQSDAMAEKFLRHATKTTAGKFYVPPDTVTPAPITLADAGL